MVLAVVAASVIALLWKQAAKMPPTQRQQADAQATRSESESPKFPNAVLIIENRKGRTVIPLAPNPQGRIAHTHQSVEGVEETLDVVAWKRLETNEDGDRYKISLTIPGTHGEPTELEKESLFRGSHTTLYSEEQVSVELALKEDAG
jgi:hypothetical protein